jgi:MFS family permease
MDSAPEPQPSSPAANFRLLFTGQSVSLFGTAITMVALPAVAVLSLHATTFEVALVSAAAYVPYAVLGLIVGVYIDLWNRRTTLIWSDAARVVIFGSIPVLWALGLLQIWYLIAAALLAGVFDLSFNAAFQAYFQEITPPADLTRGNAWLQGSESVALLGGPGIGGVLIQAIGAAFTISADAASYVISVASILAIRDRRAAIPDQRGARNRPRLRSQIAEGLRYLTRDRLLRTWLWAVAHYNLCDAARQALLVLFLLRVVRVAPAFVGLLLAVSGVGALLGATMARPLVDRLGTGPAMTLALVIGPGAGLLIPFTYPGARLSLFVVASLVLGMAEAVLKIAGVSYRQATVPERMLGRVVATNRTLTWGPTPLGAVLAGVLGQLAGVRPALFIIAILTAAVPLWVLIWPVWSIRSPAAAKPDAPAPGAS